jgi:hypothetical protein
VCKPFFGVGRPGAYGFHFNIEVVIATIAYKIDLAAVGQEVGLVFDRPFQVRVLSQELRNRELVHPFGNLPVIPFRISAARAGSGLKLLPEEVAATNPSGDKLTDHPPSHLRDAKATPFDGRFIYVGMSGRGITAETVRRNTPQGLYTRLQSHASGRRSGDQLCVYVADRLVLPNLSQQDIAAIASGRHQMDAFVRRYIHENLSYRFVMLPDGAAAYTVEAAIKSGKWEHGRPLLNPGR